MTLSRALFPAVFCAAALSLGMTECGGEGEELLSPDMPTGAVMPKASPSPAPEDPADASYTVRIHAVLTSNSDGSRKVYEGDGKERLVQGIRDWIRVADVALTRDAKVKVEFDPATDLVEEEDTLLNILPPGPEELLETGWCSAVCTDRDKEGSCVKRRVCTEQNDDLTCKTKEERETRGEPSCDKLFKASWKHADEYASRHPGKVVVFFRWGPAPWKTGGGFSFPGLDHDFVAMPNFWSTGGTMYKIGPTELESAIDCDGAPAYTPRCRTREGWIAGQNRILFTHELGHYLGLPHTFAGGYYDDKQKKWIGLSGRRDVAKAVLAAKGDVNVFEADGIADTPPDPGIVTFLDGDDGWVDPCGSQLESKTGIADPQAAFAATLPGAPPPKEALGNPRPEQDTYLFQFETLGFDLIWSFRDDDGQRKIRKWSITPPRENLMSYYGCGEKPKVVGMVPPPGENLGASRGQAVRIREVLRTRRNAQLCGNPANSWLPSCREWTPPALPTPAAPDSGGDSIASLIGTRTIEKNLENEVSQRLRVKSILRPWHETLLRSSPNASGPPGQFGQFGRFGMYGCSRSAPGELP